MSDDEYLETGHFRLCIGERQWLVQRFCPHRAGRLDYGDVNEQRLTITCPLHRSVFCLRSGRQLAGPPCGSIEV